MRLTPFITVDQRRAYVQQHAGKESAAAIASKLRVSVAIIYNDASKLGISLKPNSSGNEPRESVSYIRKYAGKKTCAQIAEHLGITLGGVRSIASANRISLAMKGPKRAKKPKGPSSAPVGQRGDDQRQTSDADLEEFSRRLRAAGWTVLRPDPFRDLHVNKATSRAGVKQ